MLTELQLLEAHDPNSLLVEVGGEDITYGEMTRLVDGRLRFFGDRSGEQTVVRPRPDLSSIVDLLAVPATGATMVVVGADRPDAAQLAATASAELRPSHSILFTSGSNGLPKGVRLAATNWERAAAASMAHLGHGPDDRWLCALPLHHVSGLGILYRCLYSGGAIVLISDQGDVAPALERVTWASLVPTQLTRVLAGRTRFVNAPKVLVGGGPSRPETVAAALRAGLRALPTYGMTETTGQVATAQTAGGPLRPLPGVEVSVATGDLLTVAGPMVMKGYLGEADAGGLFLTSDRGRVTTEGSVEVLGRADRMIITGGENVDPAAVELLVTRHPQVVEVTVVGVPDPEWGERMVAAYAGQASVPELEALLDDLPAYARPKQWFRLEALPRTELGKVDHAHLYRLLQI